MSSGSPAFYSAIHTVIRMRVSAATETYSFIADTGTLRGGWLRLVMFIIYLENALKNVRLEPEHEILLNEVAYADDAYCCGIARECDYLTLRQHERIQERDRNLKKTPSTKC